MCLYVVFCEPQTQVDVDKLFHANPPSLSQNGPKDAQKPASANFEPANAVLSDIFDDDLKPYRGSRHDEFDWALTKVLKTKI